MYNYPKTNTHAAFNASFRVNFIAGSGGGGGFKIIGTEGAMEVDSSSVKLTRAKLSMVPGGYSMISYTEENQKKIKNAYAQKNLESRESSLNIGETIYAVSYTHLTLPTKA